MSLTQKVIDANIALHSKLAANYQTCEPHFRPENVAKVEHRLATLVAETRAERLLDLGCGTGFMIDIAKRHVRHIVGVDVTPAMLERVDRSGPASIELVNQDTGTYSPAPGSFELVTAYSFLHHLADLGPTFRTASAALCRGGRFYADLDPNFYFWESINALGAPRCISCPRPTGDRGGDIQGRGDGGEVRRLARGLQSRRVRQRRRGRLQGGEPARATPGGGLQPGSRSITTGSLARAP